MQAINQFLEEGSFVKERTDRINRIKSDSNYDFYAEQLSRFMAGTGIIQGEELKDIENYIRGFA